VNTFKSITEAYKALLLAKQKEEEEDRLFYRYTVTINKQSGYGLNLRDEGIPPLNRPLVTNLSDTTLRDTTAITCVDSCLVYRSAKFMKVGQHIKLV
jgi:hypothetical protein